MKSGWTKGGGGGGGGGWKGGEQHTTYRPLAAASTTTLLLCTNWDWSKDPRRLDRAKLQVVGTCSTLASWCRAPIQCWYLLLVPC